ncbi:MAG: cysteine synthase [SAR202 cluster bacterium]|nr:cysteine synthase [SAR202 cluster bacterium]
MPYKTLIDTIGNTPLVELRNMNPGNGVRIFAKLEGQNPTGSLKDRIAKNMIENAEREGKLNPHVTILEPTSGNTGISLAFVAKLKGYRVKVVMPDNVSPERTQLLRAYGADIVYSPGKYGSNGAIAMAQEMMARSTNGDYVMLYQYGNQANPGAHYDTTADEIIRDLPDVDVFVAGLGTGGTLMGVGRRLKEYRKDIKVIAVAPEPDEAIQGLRDLEEGFIPPILDLSLLDARIMGKSRDAFRGVRELMRQEGIFAGISSGAVVWAAMKTAERMHKGNIVCLLADGGWKYLSTGLWTKDAEEMEKEARGKVWW